MRSGLVFNKNGWPYLRDGQIKLMKGFGVTNEEIATRAKFLNEFVYYFELCFTIKIDQYVPAKDNIHQAVDFKLGVHQIDIVELYFVSELWDNANTRVRNVFALQ